MNELERYWERIAALYPTADFRRLVAKFGEDAVHTALVNIARRIARSGNLPLPGEELQRYLYTATRNTAIVNSRRERRYNRCELPPDLRHPAPGPEREAIASLALEDALQMIRTFQPQVQTALTMTALGYRQREIGAEQGRSEGAVKSSLHRGRERLRGCQ